MSLHGCMYNLFVGNPFIRGRPLCVGILCVPGGTPYPTLVLLTGATSQSTTVSSTSPVSWSLAGATSQSTTASTMSSSTLGTTTSGHPSMQSHTTTDA